MSEAKKGSPKIALNMSMVKTIMWDKGPDYTFERVKAAGLSYFELSQVDMTDEYIDQVLEASQSPSKYRSPLWLPPISECWYASG